MARGLAAEPGSVATETGWGAAALDLCSCPLELAQPPAAPPCLLSPREASRPGDHSGRLSCFTTSEPRWGHPERLVLEVSMRGKVRTQVPRHMAGRLPGDTQFESVW